MMDIFKKLKQYYWPYKMWLLGSIIALIFVTAITVVYPIVLQITIDEVIRGEKYSWIPYISLIFIALMGIKAIATYIDQYFGDYFGIRSVFSLREALYEKLQRLSFRYYDNAKTGDIMSKLTADVDGFRFFLSFGFSEFVRIILLMTASLGVMFYYSIPLALITMAVMPFLAVVVFRFDRIVHPAFRRIRKSYGNLNTRVQENISGMNTVKSLSREDFEVNRFLDRSGDYRQTYINTSNIWARYFPLMEFIGNVSVVVLLAYGGYLVMNGELQLGELVAFFNLVWLVLGPLMNFGFVINLFSQSKASGERLLSILEEDEDIINDPAVDHASIRGSVVFEDVTLTYPGEEDKALRNVTLHAPAGTTIGLIGATGSGKTSVTQVLTRFYEPESGRVYVDGKPVKDYDLQHLRRNVGVVLQESFLFSTTIKENIAYGNPLATEEDIVSAAKRAQAHDFIMETPKGYDTLLGERGMGLSGGQKQRIAIARAILIDPAVLILDDATSAVDMETEFKIQKALREVMKGRTTFIIAHRISSIKHADEILLLDRGRVVERGGHEDLLVNNGTYRRIYDIQYKDRDKIFKAHRQ
ncbi:ATP-binding cassette subfamily B protein/subfamily B ATP-binding cassette protein MsbA [Salimicrobium jeotgali]|nr:ATP-binding cassette subfamily B protein/subfamily B ATP-binding cassette protein MsbA [Salimicrobium jeotgali]